ncbi:MAG: hypothetical protein AAGH79_14015 [Bacteroidota bacterium]
MQTIKIFLFLALLPIWGFSQSTWMGVETSVGRTRVPTQSTISVISNKAYHLTNTYAFVVQRRLGNWVILGGGIGLTHSINRVKLEFPPFGNVPAVTSRFRSNTYFIDLRLQSLFLLWQGRSQGYLRAEGFGGPFMLGMTSLKQWTLDGHLFDEDRVSTVGNGDLYQYGFRLGLGTRCPIGGRWLIAPEIVLDRPFFHPGVVGAYDWRWGLQIGVFRKI